MIVVLAEPGVLAAGTRIRLSGEEAHHLRVRRVRFGEPVRVVDGAGGMADGRLVAPETVELTSLRRLPPPAPLILAVGAGDRDRFGWLVEKAAELDVTAVIPLRTERTEGVSGGVRDAHLVRLGKRALQAIKQSGAAWAPEVHPPQSISELASGYRSGARWLADREGTPPTWSEDQGPSVLAVVGPEGGLSSEERRFLLAEGFMPVRLGRRTMRFETAAIAAAVAAGLLRKGDRDD